MKTWKKLVLIGLVAIIAIFGITACDDDDDGGESGGGGFTPEYALGDTGPGGGKIFYYSAEGFTMTDDDSTAHYLEAAPEDMPKQLAWTSTGLNSTNITGTATAIGTGRKNTALILATDASAPAAKACNEYTNNGKTDWFLPSKDELNQLYVNRTHIGNSEKTYYSSSQYSTGEAWNQSFSNDVQMNTLKWTMASVRAVRAF